MRRLPVELTLAALLWAPLAPARAARGEPKGRRPGLEGAPASAFSRQNPYARDPDAVAAGRKLYAIHCSKCHGERGEGWRRAPSLMSHEVHQATPGAVFWYLTNGDLRRGMPAWSRLPEARRWQLEAFLRTLSAPE